MFENQFGYNEHCFFVVELLWSAPECLRAVTSERFVDRQKVDIYALGVVLKEVFTRSGPYTEYPFLVPHGETTHLSPHASK